MVDCVGCRSPNEPWWKCLPTKRDLHFLVGGIYITYERSDHLPLQEVSPGYSRYRIYTSVRGLPVGYGVAYLTCNHQRSIRSIDSTRCYTLHFTFVKETTRSFTGCCSPNSSSLKIYSMSEMDLDPSAPVPASSPPENQFLTNGAGPAASGSGGQNTNRGGETINGITVPGGSTNGIGANGSSAEQITDLNAMFAARREEEMARRDRSLAEFLVMLDGYKPMVSWPKTCHAV